jgi:phosphoribosylglycinamide formyltransferase 1
MKRIAIMISGRGSNMQAIVNTCSAQRWSAQVVAVISNRPEASGLAFAQQRGIPIHTIDHQRYSSREAFDAALAQVLKSCAPDIVVLAGFMRILTPDFVGQFAGRMLNIHPSLLPAFTGLHTHRRALEAGCKLAGTTVHFVTAELDHGPIVAQAVVPIWPDDTEASLAARVLTHEHHIYPLAVQWLVQDQLTVRQGIVHHRLNAPQLFFDTDTRCTPTP